LFGSEIELEEVWLMRGQSERAYEVEKLGALILKERPLAKPSAQMLRQKWAQSLKQKGFQALPMDDACWAFLARARFVADELGLDIDLSHEGLLAQIDDWLLMGMADDDIGRLTGSMILAALKTYCGHDLERKIESQAPPFWVSPLGNRHLIDYASEAGPTVSVRVQECFGLKAHPQIGKNQRPLIMSLLSPAQRPLQTTKDLPAFWQGSWAEVKKEMRGRYPRHVWPDDPSMAVATLKAKPRTP